MEWYSRSPCSGRSNELNTSSLVANGLNRQVAILTVNEIQGGIDCPQALIAVAEFVGLPSGPRHQTSPLSRFTHSFKYSLLSVLLKEYLLRVLPEVLIGDQ